ncbi:MAG: PAS domain-containing protein [Elusimicrobiota bacterium]
MRVAYCRPGTDAWPAADGPPAGWAVAAVSDTAALEEALREGSYAALLRLPADPSLLMETLSRLRVAAPGLPVVVAAANDRESDAAAAVVAGASDYWLEAMSSQRLRTSLEQAALRRRSRAAERARDEALERVDDAVVVTDAEERIVYWNNAASRLYGYDYSEAVGRPLPDTLSPLWLDAETRVKAWRSLDAHGIWLGETTHARRNGEPTRVAVEISVARDGRGRRAGLLLVARPAGAVAASKAGESARDPRDVRRFLESILNSVPDPIFVKDREHRYLLVNDAYCAQMARTREALLGRTALEVFSAGMGEAFRSQDEQVFETGGEIVAEETVPDAKGEARSLIAKKTLGSDPQGHPVLVGVVRDVTEQVRALEELKRSQEQLRHSQTLEAVGRLAGGVAHDFNNVLTAIIGCAGLMLDSLPPAHPCREDADEIRRAGEQAAGLTRQLLAFARPQDAAPRVLDLREVCGDMRKMLQRLLPAAIDLEMTIPNALSPVLLDRGHAEQVLLNLVVNAGEAMPDGGRIRVVLSDAPDGGGGLRGPCVCLSVADSGAGMDEATRGRIFEPFFTTKTSGVGLGLSRVRDAVERGGGAVVVDSAPRRGSTFHVYWPRSAAALGEAGAGSAAAPRRAARAARLLVVEDDDVVRRFLLRSLEREGYSVVGAADGVEALRLSDANEGSFDAVILDVVLPRLRGTEVAARLRERQPTARVLFVSGYRTDEKSLPAGPDGCASFLSKPFTGALLVAKVRELLEPALP